MWLAPRNKHKRLKGKRLTLCLLTHFVSIVGCCNDAKNLSFQTRLIIQIESKFSLQIVALKLKVGLCRYPSTGPGNG